MAPPKRFVFFTLLSLKLMAAHAVVYNVNNKAVFYGKYYLYWAFDSLQDKVYFKVDVETNGYVALGFSHQGADMKNLDCVVVGVKSTQGYIMDLKALGKGKPAKDQRQNYVLESFSETGTKTIVEFSRKRDTGDYQDILFASGQAVHVAWAYGNNDAATYSDLVYHRRSGYSTQMLVIITPEATTAPNIVAPGR